MSTNKKKSFLMFRGGFFLFFEDYNDERIFQKSAQNEDDFLSFPNDPHKCVVRSVIAFSQRNIISVLILLRSKVNSINDCCNKSWVGNAFTQVVVGGSELNLHKHLLSTYDKTVR